MTTPDLINGIYESLGGLFISLSILKLHKDKLVRGVSFWPILFYQSWGCWNLYFYSAINCPLSWYGGIGVTIANTTWLIQMLYYLRKEKKNPDYEASLLAASPAHPQGY
jgi:hypothetical protein